MGFAREEERGERLVAAMRDGNTSSKKSRERERKTLEFVFYKSFLNSLVCSRFVWSLSPK